MATYSYDEAIYGAFCYIFTCYQYDDLNKTEKEVIQETFNNFKEKMFNFCDKICRALGHKIGIHFSKNSEINYDEMEYYANGVNRKYERPEKDKSDDMEISMQQYLALNISNKKTL